MSNQRKIFVGLSLDQKARQFIAKKIAGLNIAKNENIHFIDPENYHVTLMFLGYVKDENIPEICSELKEAFQGVEYFDLNFGVIKKAPSEENAKMIWLVGENSPALTEVKNRVEKKLSHHKGDSKKFIPHVTLARIKNPKKTLVNEEVNSEVSLMVPVYSVELIESATENGRRVYHTLDSIDLEG
ncbi:MAG: RNA 2',3'-cyclic phosphodiesterase [Candidatus Moraniibacteriota bacterium]